jgi:hypothetical protein
LQFYFKASVIGVFMTTLLWLQTGSCGGDTMSILCADSPSLEELVGEYGLEILWQPSLSVGRLDALIEAILADRQALDVLCIEGSILTGPDGSGMYDPYRGRSKMSLVRELAEKAGYVVAAGTSPLTAEFMPRRPILPIASACNSINKKPADFCRSSGGLARNSRSSIFRDAPLIPMQ